MDLWVRKWVLGWAKVRKDEEEKGRQSYGGTAGHVYVVSSHSEGSGGPLLGQMLVIRGQSVDDVNPAAPTNLVLYIIMPNPLPLHVDSLPETPLPPPWILSCERFILPVIYCNYVI